MYIPLGTFYTVTRFGSTYKVVECEQCTQRYAYQVRAAAEGYGTSPLYLDNQGAKDRAERQASFALECALRRAVEVVPCPECGWIQKDMQPLARHRHYRRLRIVAFLLLSGLILPLVFVIGIIFWPPNPQVRADMLQDAAFFTVVFGLTGGGLLWWRASACKRFDANATELEGRLALAAQRAVIVTDDPANEAEALDRPKPYSWRRP